MASSTGEAGTLTSASSLSARVPFTFPEVDGEQLKSDVPPIPPPCNHVNCEGCWKRYPQSLFPNWSPSQVERSGILDVIEKYNRSIPCTIHRVDIDDRGYFTDPGKYELTEQAKDASWEFLIQSHRPVNTRVRSLFVENMSGPVLQKLGAYYNIEPFFFSSSLSWTPSRFQEEVQPGRGDRKGCALVLDLLAVHLIRNVEGNTLISYHTSGREATSAPFLQERMHYAGQSVYWQNIFQRSPDPTFVLLIFIWVAICAWDEALEALYARICWLETYALDTSDIFITRELHIIRAHYFQFPSLLEDVRKAVVFILDTPNPAMDSLPQEEKQFSRTLLEKECRNLLSEIHRLEMSRRMQDQRLKNALNLVFSTTSINNSKRMRKLTEAAVRDSTVMKQIAYLTMTFLPSSFVAAIFGMNVGEISPGTNETLPHYFAIAAVLTLLTV
ncbi:uncharacterized protein ARMOST_14088 [Armillaria ostoyae]|uniref:Uncharacterized protein n=1 Tax=Armillaria ostoyae TaxID=47428 RepID=A0A284RPK8_ARMOS|nr:uncharacterized protein ARMOST_14088 [Armillaria ostoyae]